MEYAHRLYASKVKRKNNNKKDNYQQIIQLNINNFSFIGNDNVVDIYFIQNDNLIKLSDKLIFIQIYIPNLLRKWYTIGTQNLKEVERYLLGLVLRDKKESLEVGKGIKIMEEYVEDASLASLDDDLLEAYDKELALKDLGKQIGIEEGKQIGIEEGKQIGLEEGKNEIATKMKEKGIDLDLIKDITGIDLNEKQENNI